MLNMIENSGATPQNEESEVDDSTDDDATYEEFVEDFFATMKTAIEINDDVSDMMNPTDLSGSFDEDDDPWED